LKHAQYNNCFNFEATSSKAVTLVTCFEFETDTMRDNRGPLTMTELADGVYSRSER
jgi:hypothetical protein